MNKLLKHHLNDFTELTTNKVPKSFNDCQNQCHFSKASNPASVCIFKQRETSRPTVDESVPQAQKDFSNNFPYLFLEKKLNKNKFESAYDTKTTNSCSRRVSKPFKSRFQNPLSRRGENPRAGRPLYISNIQPIRDDNRRGTANKREHSNFAIENVSDNNTKQKQAHCRGGGRESWLWTDAHKNHKDKSTCNLQMYLEKVNEPEEIQQNTTPTTEDDPNIITVTDKNGNTGLKKIEQMEITNQNTNNEMKTRKSARIKTVNPIIRYGNSITH